MASFGASKPSPYKSDGVAALRERFDEYSVFGGTNAGVGLSSKNFAKLCRDSGVVDKRLSGTQLDLIFARSVDRGAKKLKWAQFLNALELCAAYRRTGVEKIRELIMAGPGPSLNRPSTAEAVNLHDDKALYTGTHLAGGPSTVDNKVTLDRLADRSPADIRGVKQNLHYADAEAGVSSGHHVGLSPSRERPLASPRRTPPVRLPLSPGTVPAHVAAATPPTVPATPPKPPDYFEALTRYFMRHNPARTANVGGLLARYAGNEAALFAKIEAKYGAPVLGGARTPPRTVFDKLSKQYTGSARAAHAEVRWFSPD